jgi:TP901 family phage tail tape measure protein
VGKTTETLEFLINANAAGVTKAFKDVGDAADTHLQKAQTRSDQVSANLTKFGAGAVAVAGIVGAGMVKLGSDFDSAFDKIRTQTGATGKTLEGLQGDFKSALSQVPSSMGDVSTAIGTLNQKLGLSGKPLQDLSVQFLNLSEITGTDLTKNIEGATGLFNQFGISADQQGAKLDELFRITQSTGVGFDTLTTSLAQNGSVFRAAGLSFDESASLLGLLAKNGLDASNVVPALAKSMATAAKEGKPAAEVFRDTFDAIKAAPTDTAAAGIALDVFGAKAGPKFAELVRQGTLSYDDFTAAIGNSGDTINKAAAADTFDFGEKLGILRNKIEVGLEPVLSSAFDTMTAVVGKLGDAFDALPAPVIAVVGMSPCSVPPRSARPVRCRS